MMHISLFVARYADKCAEMKQAPADGHELASFMMDLLGEVTARGQSFPALMYGSDAVMAANMSCTFPPIRSFSAGARTTVSIAIVPLAPALFSTTTSCPRRCEIHWPINLAWKSFGPPGGNFTTMRTGRVGYLCVAALSHIKLH
jgi:hypothetical protein